MLKLHMAQMVAILLILNVFGHNTLISNKNLTQEPSKWYEGELVLKNGTIKKGLIKYISTGGALGGLQSFNKISFKESENSKKKKFKKELIDYFIVYKTENKPTKYTYIKIKKNKTVLARVKIEGKASLYFKVVNDFNQNNGMSPAPLRPLDYFCYVQKDNDDIASGMFMPNVLKSFKDEASEYFKSCKSVSDKIKEGKLGIDDREEIVSLYNNCF